MFKRLIEYPSKRAKIIDIDFDKPWWNIYLKQKATIIIVLFAVCIENILNTIFPLFIAKVLETESYQLLFSITAVYLIQEIINWFIWSPAIILLYTQTMTSFRYCAFKTLLAIDPMYHAQQSSGVGIGKIRRTMEAYKNITKNIFNELIPLGISIITATAALMSFNITVGLIASSTIIGISGIFCYLVMINTYGIEKQTNYDDDRANHVGTESLIQANFIRASFASNRIREQLTKTFLQCIKSIAKLTMTHRFMRGMFLFSYIISISTITGLLLYLVKQGTTTSTTAIALIITILRSTAPLYKLDKRIQDTLSSRRKIADFYRFIKRFGKRTFPVFPHHIDPKNVPYITQKDPITLKIENVTVAYPHHKPIFTHLSLSVSSPLNAPNKLFGIIGPSGVGKTTLISLLGGQLKPPTGNVTINDYNIYKISDKERQQLISLQGQTATSMHGTLRYNLTFGLPREHPYSDTRLIDLLESVGLWKLFKEKQGLQTMVGESGMTLSGGQRQRLNFANLFLRAKAYKPAVILIDEPTSSLDEISEQKITDMITELAKTSLTIVIAHRIKTLENAQKILDFSALSETNNLEFLTLAELQERSLFYQQLVSGTADIEL